MLSYFNVPANFTEELQSRDLSVKFFTNENSWKEISDKRAYSVHVHVETGAKISHKISCNNLTCHFFINLVVHQFRI